MKILIVEDDPGYREILERYLSGLGDSVEFAQNWESAEPHFDADIFWLDVFVPPHGVEKIKIQIGTIRLQNEKAVIFVVSGMCDYRLRLEMLDAGADVVAEKHDVTTRNQIIALMISALMKAEERGKDSMRFLQKARELLANAAN